MLALLLSLASHVPAVPPRADDFHWKGRIPAGQAIEIRGINGGIRAAAGSGPEVEVTAVKHAHKSNPDDVKIEVVTHADGGVTICAVYPGRHGSTNSCDAGGHGDNNMEDNDVSVEFTVTVPGGVRLVATTVNGDVGADNLGAQVEATTVNGSVDVSTRGAAEATTVNGSIRVRMGTVMTDDATFTTVNGDITVSMPAGLACDFEANTVNGSIESAFPVTVSGRMKPTSVRGTIGTGGKQLKLTTVNGSIALQKS
jgi:hypothetical protein